MYIHPQLFSCEKSFPFCFSVSVFFLPVPIILNMIYDNSSCSLRSQKVAKENFFNSLP